MRLTSIELQNYRCYERFSVSFEPRFNVIAGVNGSGKTSLLKAIRDVLALSTYFLSIQNGFWESLSERDTARMSVEVWGNRYRFEPQYPIRLIAAGQVNGLPRTWSVERGSSATPAQASPENPGIVLRDMLNAAVSPNTVPLLPNVLPIIAFYPVYRKWPAVEPNEMAAATNRESRVAGYSNWWDASADSAALQAWVISKSLERMQLATDRIAGWDAVEDDELAFVNAALKTVIDDANGLRYDFVQKSLMMEWSDGRPPTAFQNLSDGQRVATALVADIARRMCLLNPQLGQSVTQETPGVVLIDELDIHLHPKWQRSLVRGLPAAFPRVQFIAASHSPQILSELHPQEIIVLHREGPERPQVSYGLDSSRVLEQIMDAEPRPAEVEKALSDLFKAIEHNELSDARNRLTNLKEVAPGIPELVGAEALIKRKEVVGR
ncbi:DNA replication and repair protein RecF [Caballeronia novacaledonica]|uniref:DNA replication and repair protein RecF n=1 Tax=Caballeronia novacaledonica TaxID=1544861 RepID=A0A2U3I6A6_9BURK|nr:AAA family ATPase [Caballeronia novacaledonica]SPB15699.1 DNA replication and repair protein RecF [Caballeronia novacaledonica]